MFQVRYALIVVLGFLVGCNLSPTELLQFFTEGPSGAGRSVQDVAPETISDPNDPARNSPGATQAPISVRLSNPTPRDADCRVTMEIIGQEVHLSFRRVVAATGVVVIGPDQADIVRIEVTFLGEPPAAMETQVLRIHRDFEPDTTINFVLALPPPPPQSACCFDDGTCQLLTEDECSDANGQYQGDGTGCDPNPCPQPEGACCFDDGTCQLLTAEDCTSEGGQYQGDLTACDPNACPPPEGACCFADGSCQVLTAEDCTSEGGQYQGDDTGCDPNPCPRPHGACCFEDGRCFEMDWFNCGDSDGEYQGDGTSCDPNPCPQPEGACCFEDGTCVFGSASECSHAGGQYQGGTPCHPNPCPRLDCPDDSLFAQPVLEIGDPNDPPVVFSEVDMDGSNWLLYEYFSGVNGEVCDIHWWGLTVVDVPDVGWSDCFESDPTFEITFYQAGEGPGDVVCSYIVTANVVPTDLFYGSHQVMYFSVDALDPCCTIRSGYVSIQGHGDVDCWFAWAGSGLGDGWSLLDLDGDFVSRDFDPSVCLTGTPFPTGACCLWDGTCVVTTEDMCSSQYEGEYQGDGTSCVPNPCPSPPGNTAATR